MDLQYQNKIHNTDIIILGFNMKWNEDIYANYDLFTRFRQAPKWISVNAKVVEKSKISSHLTEISLFLKCSWLLLVEK